MILIRMDFKSIEQASAVFEALTNASRSYRSQAELTQTTDAECDALVDKADLIDDALKAMVQ